METERREGEQTTHYGTEFSRHDAATPYAPIQAAWDTDSPFETADPPDPDVRVKGKLREMYSQCKGMYSS